MQDPTDIPDFIPNAQPTGMEIESNNLDNYVGTIPFQQMNLRNEVMQAITECGFEHPSEVQSQVIPKALIRQDILCQAKSGMGKTAVFVISILNQFVSTDKVTSMILCHTRELAQQVEKEFGRMKQRMDASIEGGVRVACFIGGNDVESDVNKINAVKPSIVVGTPGRLMDLVKRKALDLSQLRTFVVDECDKILTSNCVSEIEYLFRNSPADKQMMMFSATISNEHKDICRKFLKNQFEVFIDDGEKLFLHGLHLFSKTMEDDQKMKYLVDILDEIDFNQVIIFVDNKQRCQRIVTQLKKESYPCGLLYGQLDQASRENQFGRFRRGDLRILVSTDLCGRGIDVEKVNLVVNFDMPRDSDQFLHRVGRAGRFGTKGVAISFVDSKIEEDQNVLEEVKKRFAVGIDELPESMKDIPQTYYK